MGSSNAGVAWQPHLQHGGEQIAEPSLELLACATSAPVALVYLCGGLELLFEEACELSCHFPAEDDGVDLVVATKGARVHVARTYSAINIVDHHYLCVVEAAMVEIHLCSSFGKVVTHIM